MKGVLIKSDSIGILASTICMMHCIATPFLFVVRSCSAVCCASAPSWWRWLDVFFLAISFFAIYQSSKNIKTWVKYTMWFSWTILLGAIVNENLNIISIHKYIIYIPAFLLVFLHTYNLKYCKCEEDNCCAG